MVDREHAGPGDHPAEPSRVRRHGDPTGGNHRGRGTSGLCRDQITPPPPKTQDCHSTRQRSWCSVARLRGTPLMVDHPLLALELPLRDPGEPGPSRARVWMSHLDPHHLARQFGVSTEQAAVLSGARQDHRVGPPGSAVARVARSMTDEAPDGRSWGLSPRSGRMAPIVIMPAGGHGSPVIAVCDGGDHAVVLWRRDDLQNRDIATEASGGKAYVTVSTGPLTTPWSSSTPPTAASSAGWLSQAGRSSAWAPRWTHGTVFVPSIVGNLYAGWSRLPRTWWVVVSPASLRFSSTCAPIREILSGQTHAGV